jgi:hypothetical protein
MKTLLLSCALKAAIATHSAWARVARATAKCIATAKSMIVCPGTIKLLRAHTEHCPEDLYRLFSPGTLPLYIAMRAAVVWPSCYSILNYSITLPVSSVVEPAVLEAVVSARDGGEDQTLLCLPEEVLDLDLVEFDHGKCSAAVADMIQRASAARPAKALVYQLGGVDVTHLMTNVFFTPCVTVHDLSIYFSHVHDLPIVPEVGVFICMLDDLEVLEWTAQQCPFT